MEFKNINITRTNILDIDCIARQLRDHKHTLNDIIDFPRASGNNDKILGVVNNVPTWIINPGLPSFTGNAGKYLTTDGTQAIWQFIPVQQQADWNETDNLALSFIQNKPYIPQNTSDLTNDSGFVVNTLTLTINGISYSLAFDRTWNLTTTEIPEGTNLYFTNARVRAALSLTTSGNNGSATYNSSTGAFNIPTYTLVGLGGVPLIRTITINGITYDLDANRTWTLTTADISELTNLYFTNSRARAAISLTTTGTSGAATYDSGTGILNIPNYTGLITGSYVPYTGAIANVNLGEWGIKGGYLGVDLTPTTTPLDAGTIAWNADDATFDMTLLNGVTLQAGQEAHFYGKATEVIPNGSAVMFAGHEGGHLLISRATQAQINTNPEYFIGIATQDFALHQFGYVTVLGKVRTLNTSAFAEGAALWVDTVSGAIGAITTTEPTAPNAKIKVGFVLRSHATQGSILVRPHMNHYISSLGDVSISSIANNNILAWATNKWVNKTIPQVLGYTPADAALILTINGTPYDLSTNRSWSVGTVTSVGLSVPTGFSVSNSPITTSGSISLNFAAGYSLPTTTKQGEWDTAYSWGDHASVGYVLGSGTASAGQLAYFTATNTINGLSTATYPSLVELSYVKGVTSSIQTQLNGKQPVGNYITSLTGEVTASGPGAASATLLNSAVIGKVLTGLNVTGGTVLSTDSILTAFGKVQNQINSLLGGDMWQGVWNATTNSPTITSSTGTKGHYYVVNVAGSTNIDGITDWKVGDWIIFNGATWDKVDNTDAVSSVNGYVGSVALVTGDILEGAGSLPGRPEQLFFTAARAQAAISSSATGLSYNNSTGVFTLTSGYVIPTTTQEANWNIAYAERNQWDGGGTGLSAIAGRASLGLGTMAQQNTGDYFTALQIQSFFSGATPITGYNKSNWDTAFNERNQWDGNGVGLNPIAGRASLGLGTMAQESASNYYTATQIQNFFSGDSAMTGYNKSNWDTSYGWGNWAASSHYIGTTLIANNRASGAQTLTGVSIDGNAVTAGGLAVHTGTNNEVNKIVRTDVNGYIQAGWINTISGDNGTTAIDRVYASSDGYIRYYTPANFRTVLDVPTRTGGGASGSSWAIGITGNAATATVLQTTRNINDVAFNGSANIIVPSIYNSSYTRITNPGGGEYITSSSTLTGAIAITLPVNMNGAMVRFTVKVYEYTTNESFEIHVGGYPYSISNTWANNPFAYIVGNPGVDRRFTVRFGYISGTDRAVIYIGELGSTWSYPQIFITDVQRGFSGETSAWISGWSIGFEASAFQGVTATISNSQVGYAVSTNTADSTVLRDGSGNFSAGTITATLNGNASTASAWQTARTLTIGSTGKSVSGGADVSWSLTEIGVAGVYLPLSGGTLSGALSGTSISMSGDISGGRIFSAQTNALVQAYDAGGTSATLRAYSGANYWDWAVKNNSNLVFDYNGSTKVTIGNTGAMTLTGALSGTTASFNASYSGGGTVNIMNWQRSGGAVAADITYNDANTTMNFGTSTAHSLNLKTSNTTRLTIGTADITSTVPINGTSLSMSGAGAFNGVMSLGNDATYGTNYKTLGLTGNADGSHRVFAGTADDLYIAAATSRGIRFWTNGTSNNAIIITPSGTVSLGYALNGTSLSMSGIGTFGGAANIDASLAVQISTTGTGTAKWFGANKNGGYGLLVGYNEATGSLSGVGSYIRNVTADPMYFYVNNSTLAVTIANTGVTTFNANVIGTNARFGGTITAGVTTSANTNLGTNYLDFQNNGSYVAGTVYSSGFNFHNGGGTVASVSSSGVFNGLGLIIKNGGVPAIQLYRDLDVGTFGTVGQGIELGARSGASTYIAGAAVYGNLDNPATSGSMNLQTLSSGTLATRLTLNSSVATFTVPISGTSLSMSGGATAASFSNGSIISGEVFNANKSNAGYYVSYFRNSSATGLGVFIENGNDNNDALRIGNAAGTANPFRFFGSGTAYLGNEVLINTTTTDGTNKLIVNGGVKGTKGTFSNQLVINQTASEIQQIINSSAITNASITQYQVGTSGGWENGMLGSVDSYKYIMSYGNYLTPANHKFVLTSSGAATFSSSVTASSFVKSGGTSSQFLKADGSVDTNTYLTTSGVAAQVTINYNNDSNSTYQMLWGSGNSVYGTAGIYCNPFTDTIYANGNIIAYASSDSRYKDNQQLITNPIGKLLALRGMTFTWNTLQQDFKGNDYGLIYQDVAAVMPEITQMRANGYGAIKYEKVIPLLVEVGKNHEQRIQELESKLEAYENKFGKLN